MRRGSDLPPSPVSSGVPAHSQWRTLGRLVPYLWAYKWRVLAAIALMVAAKSANVGVPLLLKQLIDTLDVPAGDARALLVVPVGLLLAYGALRFGNSLFNELRELVFAKATHDAARSIALSTFEHLHALSLRFHLERQTGGMTRDIERGVRGIESLVSFALFNIVATFIEVLLVLTVLGGKLDIWFAIITLCALGGYILFTVLLTEWRIQFRRQANQFDSAASTKAVDSLINYETVKYFNNEAFEAQRYDVSLQQLRAAQLKSRSTLALLNGGQQLIIAIGLVAMLWRATQGVVDGRLTLGDLVMVNAFMIQIYIPLNFLGVIYREIKQNLTDLDRMFTLMDQPQEVADAPNAQPLALRPDAPPSVRFDNVYFAYDPKRPILQGISLEIPAGKTVAVVGASGAGKSTLSRLLYRFYDIQQGRITIDEQDIAQVTQASLRRAIGIVPQDTVLFNDTIAYNIAYGRPGATQQEIEQAARAARIHDFIVAQPQGYATQVGERGLKLSGGEKQRVAIARTLLKNPPILIFDEATSALDSANERAIQNELRTVAQGKTTLVVAHRLSTVVEAHEILVMDAGRIIERGSHSQLLAQGGRYASMWALQQEAA